MLSCRTLPSVVDFCFSKDGRGGATVVQGLWEVWRERLVGVAAAAVEAIVESLAI